MNTDITLETIQEAYEKIKPYIRTTPLFRASLLERNLPSKCQLFLKLESLQVTGSFKVRGATHKMLSLTKDQLNQGIVAASGGNHGRAVAYVGHQQSLPTKIYLPDCTPPHKLKAIEAWGAETEIAGTNLDEANEIAAAAAEKKGQGFIHPYADPIVVQGQGTLGLELFREIANLDVLIVAIGGGGMMSGISTVAKALNPAIRIIGVEPEGCASMHLSLKAGEVTAVPEITTKVGTLAIRKTCEMNFRIAQKNLDDIVLVNDDEMAHASGWLWKYFGIGAELSGAASLAALLTDRVTLKPTDRVCPIICGFGAEPVQSN